MSISGEQAYTKLKHEGGVHRVQRIPTTDNSGRIHTSTATIAVLFTPTAIEVNIEDKDLKIETMRASGPGGQHVNTTSSAVRVTHVPSGIAVHVSAERSQVANKLQAMKILASKLYQKKKEEMDKLTTDQRSSMIGDASRSEKIRTYNFPADRITDHRLGQAFYGMEKMMKGSFLEEISTMLIDHEKETAFKKLEEKYKIRN